MSTNFGVITEEFSVDLEAIRSMVDMLNSPKKSSPKVRVAAVNSATLLLAATFEEFVREMARAFAKEKVATTKSFEKLPRKMTNTAWHLTMKGLSRIRIDSAAKSHRIPEEARSRFDAVFKFCSGDLTQDIYEDLIYNEHNMNPDQINSLFKVSGLADIFSRVATRQPIFANLEENEPGKAHEALKIQLTEFIRRRNTIAHSLSANQSSGADQVKKDIDMLMAFGHSLRETLDDQINSPSINNVIS